MIPCPGTSHCPGMTGGMDVMCRLLAAEGMMTMGGLRIPGYVINWGAGCGCEKQISNTLKNSTAHTRLEMINAAAK
jgi:hypothetical protein